MIIFLAINLNMCFGAHRDGSFEYQQISNIISICTFTNESTWYPGIDKLQRSKNVMIFLAITLNMCFGSMRRSF